MDKSRKCEIWKDGQWNEIEFMAMKKGDYFRLFEADGTPVVCGSRTAYLASSDPYKNEDHIGTIVSDSIEVDKMRKIWIGDAAVVVRPNCYALGKQAVLRQIDNLAGYDNKTFDLKKDLMYTFVFEDGCGVQTIQLTPKEFVPIDPTIYAPGGANDPGDSVNPDDEADTEIHN